MQKLKIKKNYKKELMKILIQIDDISLMGKFLADLLTPQEFDDIVSRWQIIKQLDKGIPQRRIAKDLGVSISKITRGSRALQDKKGGFRKVLDK